MMLTNSSHLIIMVAVIQGRLGASQRIIPLPQFFIAIRSFTICIIRHLKGTGSRARLILTHHVRDPVQGGPGAIVESIQTN